MGDSIEEQVAAILARAPSVEDHVAPFLGQIAELQKQLAKAKTNPKRQAIRRELNKLRRYVSHVTAQKRPRRQPPFCFPWENRLPAGFSIPCAVFYRRAFCRCRGDRVIIR